jgi:glutathione S-transferase
VLLYNSQPSGNCYKVRLLLAHLGIPYERRELDVVDRSNRPDVLGGKNPALRVPVLELDDGRHLAESNAILWYLADGTSRNAAAGRSRDRGAEGGQYLPGDAYERAKVLQWLFFEQYDHEPNIAVARFWVGILGQPERFAEELVAKRAGGYRALDAMESRLADGPFLVGDRYTIADISLYGYTHVADEGGFELDRYPGIRAWLDRVAAQPGHVTIDA